MKRGIILLLSLLCVAQAFPLSLNANLENTHLTREKRHVEHSNVADTEVRTIISAIVDAILDGDKKKRSEISEDDAEIEDEDVHDNSEQENTSEDSVLEPNGQSATVSNFKKEDLNINATAPIIGKRAQQSNGTSEEDGSASGSGSELIEESNESESGLGLAESGSGGDSSLSDTINKRNFISDEVEENSQSGSGDENESSDSISGSGSSEDEGTENNESEELSAAMEQSQETSIKDSIPFIESGRTKRDEEGQDKNEILKRNQKHTKTTKRVVKNKDNVATSNSNPMKNDIFTIHPPVKDSQKDNLYYNLKDNVESADIDFDSSNIDLDSTSNSESSGSGMGSADQQSSGSGSLEPVNKTSSENSLVEVPTTTIELFTNKYFPEAGEDEMYSNKIAKRDNIASEESDDDEIKNKTENNASELNHSSKIKSIDVVYLNDTSTEHSIKQQPSEGNTNTIEEVSGSEISASGEESSGDDDEENSASGVDPEDQTEKSLPTTGEEIASESEVEDEFSGEEQQNSSGSGIQNLKTLNKLKASNANINKNNPTDGIEKVPENDSDSNTKNDESKKVTTKIENETESDSSEMDGKDNSKTYQAKTEEHSNETEDGSEETERGGQSNVTESSGEEQEGSTSDDNANMSSKTKIIHQIVSDMAKAAVDSVAEMDDAEDDDDEKQSVVKKSVIGDSDLINELTDGGDDDIVMTSANGDDDEEVAKENATEELVYQGDVQVPLPKNSSTLMSPVTNAYEIDKALKSLIKSILNEDPDVKLKINQMSDKREETEEKLERDILDVMPTKPINEEFDDDKREKVFTEVKDFEGLVDALSQQKSLDPWKHDVIVKKLEKDLLNHLSIPESDEEFLRKQEDELMETSEMEYIKEKISEVEENTSEFAQRHSENLETVKQFAISSLTPIIESLPLKKRDLNELANKISKSAWLRMVTNSRRKAHVRKIKAGFKRLMLFD